MLKELEQIFPDVSSMTLRRDLEFLESTGEAIKIKGGIRSVKSIAGGDTEPVYAQRILQNSAEKEKIAVLSVYHRFADDSIRHLLRHRQL
jgi:DeoR/GlpR family transcriptional regulator of sugar metabolism